jgi:hypothetical protein
LTKQSVKTIACILLTAALLSLLTGCAEAAVQTLDITLATPTPPPQVVKIQEGAADAPVYGMSVLSQFEGEVQADGTILTENGERLTVLGAADPTPTIALTPSPVPTAPPPTPTPTPSPAPTQTATPEPTAKAAENTATPKPTAKATSTPKVTATPKPTATPTAFVITPAPIATPAQTDSQQPPSVSGAYSGEDVLLAARVAYFESGKSEEGYRAVVCVILNRVEASKWPGSVYDVVYQKNQFSVINRSDFLTKTVPDSVIGYANDVLNNGNRPLPSHVMSFRSATTEKVWGSRTYYGTFGGNDYYS